MLKSVQIKSSDADNEELKKIFESAFPKGDQYPPYSDIIRVVKENEENLDYTAYYDGEILVGLTMVFILKRFNFGIYFAVREDLRGKGYGQNILTSLLEKYSKGNPFVIGAESHLEENAPNLEMRKRRHAFYIRKGLKDTGISFNYNGVLFAVMTNKDEPISQQDCDEIYASLPD